MTELGKLDILYMKAYYLLPEKFATSIGLALGLEIGIPPRSMARFFKNTLCFEKYSHGSYIKVDREPSLLTEYEKGFIDGINSTKNN